MSQLLMRMVKQYFLDFQKKTERQNVFKVGGILL